MFSIARTGAGWRTCHEDDLRSWHRQSFGRPRPAVTTPHTAALTSRSRKPRSEAAARTRPRLCAARTPARFALRVRAAGPRPRRCSARGSGSAESSLCPFPFPANLRPALWPSLRKTSNRQPRVWLLCSPSLLSLPWKGPPPLVVGFETRVSVTSCGMPASSSLR